MSGNSEQHTTANVSPRWDGRLVIPVFGVVGLLWLVSFVSPIPGGNENPEKAKAFLKEQFPDRELSPHDSDTAAVAVVYQLIRSGPPEVARRAIAFATEQRFGYAAPT
jgi:hypothetical protein